MFNRTSIALIAIIILGCISCSKKDVSTTTPSETLPQPYTDNVDSITATSVRVFGGLYTNGSQNVSEAGFCWGTDSLPTLADNHVQIQTVANFFVTITGLSESTTYHVRAYAKNSAGLAYGNSIAVTTLSLVPVVQTTDIYSVSSDFAILDGKVLSQGNAPVIRYGICWSTNPNPTINDDTTIGDMNTGFFGELDNLTVNTTYYARAYATNSYGTGYGDTLSFTTAYWIGEIFGGGKIVYVDNTKVHGLIASTTDLANYYPWDNDNYVEYTYAWSFDDGGNNTDLIMSVEGNTGTAAAACRNYYGGGYSDWFLPAVNQLYYLFAAKDNVEVGTTYYWSSTESATYSGIAWAARQSYPIGESQASTKNLTYLVRPFRAF